MNGGSVRIVLLTAVLSLTATVGQAQTATVGQAQTPTGYGPNPELPPPDTTHRTARFVRGVGWTAGTTPVARPGFRVALFADKLRNPRWLYVLPNGDVLVAESANPGAASDTALTPQALGARWGARLRGMSANRITLFRDTTGDGSPDVRSVLLQGLKTAIRHDAPRRLALRGEHRRVAALPVPAGPAAHHGTGPKDPGSPRAAITTTGPET
jgi:glucose/arabinose dehydrogenase